jgi:hypothetical protein
MLHAGFLLGFNSEDGGDIFLRKSVDFQRATWRYIPEDETLYNYQLFKQI